MYFFQAAGEDTKDDKDLKKDTLVKTTAKPKVEKEVTPKKEGSEKAAEVKEKELKKKEEELDIKLKVSARSQRHKNYNCQVSVRSGRYMTSNNQRQ